MKTAVINFKVNSAVKKEVSKIADDLGMSLSSILSAYLMQLRRVKKLDFSLDEDEVVTERLKNAYVKTAKDFRANKNVSPKFSNAKSAISYLKNL